MLVRYRYVNVLFIIIAFCDIFFTYYYYYY